LRLLMDADPAVVGGIEVIGKTTGAAGWPYL